MKKTLLIGFVAAAAILLVAQTKLFGPRNLQSNDIRVEYANEGATGTTVNKLAKLTGAPSTAIITATTDTSGIIGIVVGGAGTTGNAQVAVSGKAACVFDSATTAGHYVINDTSTAGDCMDGGATYPTSGQVLGVVTSTNGGAGTYTVDLSLKQPQAGGAGGGNATSTGTFATNPGTCTDGDVRFPSDSFYLLRCLSNAWIPWGPFFPMTAPVSGDFAWVNQGGATLDTTNGGILLTAPASGANSARIRKKSAPGLPYTITASFNMVWLTNTTGGPACGIGFRESGTNKLYTLAIQRDNTINGRLNVFVYRWTNATTYTSTAYGGLEWATIGGGPLVTMKIGDTGIGGNVTFSIGNGNNTDFSQLFSESRTAFMAGAPDEVLFFANTSNAAEGAGIRLLSWH